MILKNILIPALMMASLACSSHKDAGPAAGDIRLSWELYGNDHQRWITSSSFVIKNAGKQDLNDHNWKIYFNQMGKGIIPESISADVLIKHVNGDLFCISPKEGFVLGPDEEVQIAYEKRGSIIKEVEAPSGPYIVFLDEGKEDRAEALEFYDVAPFPEMEELFSAERGIPIPDAAWVYEQNKHMHGEGQPDVPGIIPSPSLTQLSDETIVLEKSCRITWISGLETEAGYLGDRLEELFGSRPEEAEGLKPAEDAISLILDENAGDAAGAYRLSVTRDEGVKISAPDASGVFYGIQSLLSILPPKAWGIIHDKLEIKCVKIIDSPAFEYRGIMLDVSRNFHKPEAIMKMMDAMALYKLNKLHLSLTNDEAWRIEIPSLPELTEVGGYRGHTTSSRDHLLPAYGSGPYPDPGQGMGSGFFGRDDFIGLLKYAAERHIEVIPEINFPGHARAAINAMENRYERLMNEGKEEEAEMYRLIDPDDASVYNSAQNFNDNISCVCIEGPYRFFEKVVDELILMYSDAGLELKLLHAGGDEVPQGSWTASPICATFLQDYPEIGGPDRLQAYFEGRILEILSRKNLVMGGWEEVALLRNEEGKLIPNPDFVGSAMLPYVWNSLGEYLDLGNRLANAGFPVVLCNVDNLYFDLAYTHHPAEPGLYWGGFVDTRRALEFAPFDVFASTLTDSYRRPIEIDQNAFESLRKDARDMIAGLQGQLWSETMSGSGMLEYYYLPKMLGLAERAWAGHPDWAEITGREDRIRAMDEVWMQFASVIGLREMPKLNHVFGGYSYRIPPPGARIIDGKLHANVAFPGLEIRYTRDGSEPGPDSELYTAPFEMEGSVVLRCFNTAGRGGRSSEVKN